MKQFLLKYADFIFWTFIVLTLLNLFSENYFGALTAVWMLIPYFIFKKSAKDRWFLTYYWSYVLYGIFYFLYKGFLLGNMSQQAIPAVIIALGSYFIYKNTYEVKGNKTLSWILYFVITLLSIFVSTKLGY